jgi:hypothetical protein
VDAYDWSLVREHGLCCACVDADVFRREKKIRVRDVLCVCVCALCLLVSAQEFMRMVLPKDLKYKISCYS